MECKVITEKYKVEKFHDEVKKDVEEIDQKARALRQKIRDHIYCEEKNAEGFLKKNEASYTDCVPLMNKDQLLASI